MNRIRTAVASRLRVPVELGLLLAVYFGLALTTLFVWQERGKFPVTGDEPHYLVMASGIVRHFTLEQTIPYKEEFATREIYPYGMAPVGSEPDPQNTHAISGPNGLYSVHSIGLPLLLAVPYALGGIVGAKLSLVFLSGIAIVISWKISQAVCQDKRSQFWSVLAVAVGLPLIPASNQIYPDVPAGLICLASAYCIVTPAGARALTAGWGVRLAIAFLPWLHMKFAAPALVVSLALAYVAWRERRELRNAGLFVLPVLLSLALLALYNHHAFGNALGPYPRDALEVSKTSLMVLLGLHVDQNQGFLLQNPLHFIGLLSVGPLMAFNWRAAVFVFLTYLSLMVPNALHANWYGGWSFVGRFGWAPALVFFVPTIFGLSRLRVASSQAFYSVVAASLALQAVFYLNYTFSMNFDFYNRAETTVLESYPILYGAVGRWLPALYAGEWAFQYSPNLVFAGLTLVLMAIGSWKSRRILGRG